MDCDLAVYGSGVIAYMLETAADFDGDVFPDS